MPTHCCVCYRRLLEGQAFPMGADMEPFLANRCGLRRMPVLLDLARLQVPPWHTCNQCNVFVQRKRRRSGGTVQTPLVKLLRYIVSGGATCKPDGRSMSACLQTLSEPHNPVLELFGVKLKHAVEKLTAEGSKRRDTVPRLFWEHNGQPIFFSNRRAARNVRRHMDTEALMRVREDNACRHCAPQGPTGTNYALVLAREGRCLEEGLLKLEREKGMVPYVSTFCSACARVSVLSYQHDCALTRRMGIQPMPDEATYYTHQLCLAERVEQLLCS